MITRALLSLFGLIVTSAAFAADIYILGESHDNPAHHKTQAAWISDIKPKAVVFEMLEPGQERAIAMLRDRTPQAMRDVTRWDQSGWPEFDLYKPIFLALGDVPILGAGVPREQARAAFDRGVFDAFGKDADIYGLMQPLSDQEQSAREALQFASHCGALPKEMLPMMVDVQRLRDATLARRTYQAFQTYGAPIVVITGNGHARRDWGMVQYLPSTDLSVFALGQGEGTVPPDGDFDQILYSDPIVRDDPCAVFNKGS